jgi:hypothetical protein
MTKFKLELIEKVIVKNLVQDNLDNLISECNQKRQREVYWVNGMIISIPKLIYGGNREYEDMVKGIQYFAKVIFVKFPKCVSSITKKNCVDYVRVLDYSNNNKIKELANWIESQPIWKTIPEPSQGDKKFDD